MALASGGGRGAYQTVWTVREVVFMLTIVAGLRWSRKGGGRNILYLAVDFVTAEGSERPIDRLAEVVSRHVESGDLRRVDARGDSVEVTYFIDVAAPERISALIEDLKGSFPGIGVTFIDQNQLPSV